MQKIVLLSFVFLLPIMGCRNSNLISGNLSGNSTAASSGVPVPDPTASPASCSFNGQAVPSGNSITAYQSGSVSFGSTCVSQSRTCSDGVLSGSYTFGSCAVGQPASCTFNGQPVASGQSISVFTAQSVAYGSSCSSVSQSITCTNGSFPAGTYYPSCSVAAPAACSFNGQPVASGSTVTAYQSGSVPFGSTCVSQSRACSNGALSGSYTFGSCAVGQAASCTFNGQTVASGQSISVYPSQSVPYGSSCTSESISCTNGSFPAGTYYPSCSVAAPAACSFNGQTVASGSSVTAYQAPSVPFGSTCVSQSRSCSNGTLSGSYASASCAVSPPASCTFNGQSVASGSSVTAYTSQTVADGLSCSSVQKSITCTNGSFPAGTYYPSCSVAAPTPAPTPNPTPVPTPVNHFASIAWNASTSTVTGYYIYRGTSASGPYTKLNSTAQTALTYTDSSVQGGVTYYYVTTAVNTSGVESGYSNQITVAIP